MMTSVAALNLVLLWCAGQQAALNSISRETEVGKGEGIQEVDRLQSKADGEYSMRTQRVGVEVDVGCIAARDGAPIQSRGEGMA